MLGQGFGLLGWERFTCSLLLILHWLVQVSTLQTMVLLLGCSVLSAPKRNCVLSHHREIYLVFAALFTLVVLAPLHFMDIGFPVFAHFAKVDPLVAVKTLYTTGWALLPLPMLVITTSLTSSWIPMRSLQECITFNWLVLSFTDTINLG